MKTITTKNELTAELSQPLISKDATFDILFSKDGKRMGVLVKDEATLTQYIDVHEVKKDYTIYLGTFGARLNTKNECTIRDFKINPTKDIIAAYIDVNDSERSNADSRRIVISAKDIRNGARRIVIGNLMCFPGHDDGVEVHYDFSGDGRYLIAVWRMGLEEEFRFQKYEVTVHGVKRVIDSYHRLSDEKIPKIVGGFTVNNKGTAFSFICEHPDDDLATVIKTFEEVSNAKNEFQIKDVDGFVPNVRFTENTHINQHLSSLGINFGEGTYLGLDNPLNQEFNHLAFSAGSVYPERVQSNAYFSRTTFNVASLHYVRSDKHHISLSFKSRIFEVRNALGFISNLKVMGIGQYRFLVTYDVINTRKYLNLTEAIEYDIKTDINVTAKGLVSVYLEDGAKKLGFYPCGNETNQYFTVVLKEETTGDDPAQEHSLLLIRHNTK